MDWRGSLQTFAFKMQMSLREGIQVINNCNFMNSLFPCSGKITKHWGKVMLNEEVCVCVCVCVLSIFISCNPSRYITSFHFRMNKLFIYLFIYYVLFIEREREKEWWRCRERESKAGSMLSTEPNAGLHLTTKTSWPEELLAQLTEPPRHLWMDKLLVHIK